MQVCHNLNKNITGLEDKHIVLAFEVCCAQPVELEPLLAGFCLKVNAESCFLITYYIFSFLVP